MTELYPYKLVAWANPAEGADEEAFGRWYDETHLVDMVGVQGVRSAQRFRLLRSAPSGAFTRKYLCLYDFEATGDEDARNLVGRLNAADLPLSDTLDVSSVNLAVYKAAGPEVKSKS